jgi:2-dehydro-3-deoxyphosphogluconate aldolase/(4S)-4-hydroxy-2-oxoglutarate aldolase
MSQLRTLLASTKVLPVLTIHSTEDALLVCSALAAGGIRAVEITLRTPAALAAIQEVKRQLPEFIVAAGTVRSVSDMQAVVSVGVDFAVSPGFTPMLSQCAESLDLPFLPGVSTPSEIIAGSECGHRTFKLFPAAAVGGIPLLKALASPFGDILFCPTGGIGPHDFLDYLSLPNVLCIGGSWMVDPRLIEARQWDMIKALASECVTLQQKACETT